MTDGIAGALVWITLIICITYYNVKQLEKKKK